MAMTLANLRTAIRSLARQEVGGQIPTDNVVLDIFIDQSYQQLRRRIRGVAPTLYVSVKDDYVLAPGADTLAKPADFDDFIRLEKLNETDSSKGRPVSVSDELSPDVDGAPLTFREEGEVFVLSPSDKASADGGMYRLTYVWKPVAGYTSVDVPAGFEEIIMNQVIGRFVKPRLEDDANPFLVAAESIWNEQAPLLGKRYGKHPQPGLRRTRVFV